MGEVQEGLFPKLATFSAASNISVRKPRGTIDAESRHHACKKDSPGMMLVESDASDFSRALEVQIPVTGDSASLLIRAKEILLSPNDDRAKFVRRKQSP
jgi:hypothetical protein